MHHVNASCIINTTCEPVAPMRTVWAEVLTLLLGVAIIVANAFSLLVFGRTLHQHPTVLWFISLSVSDLIFGACCLINRSSILILNAHYPPIIYPVVVFAVLSTVLSPTSLAVLSADRWAAVEFPRIYMQHSTPARHRLLCVLVWFYFLVAALICVTLMPVPFVYMPQIDSTFMATWSTWYSDWFFAMSVPIAIGLLIVSQLRLGYLAGKWKIQRMTRRKRAACVLQLHSNPRTIASGDRCGMAPGSSPSLEDTQLVVESSVGGKNETREQSDGSSVSGVRAIWQLRRTIIVVSANVVIYVVSHIPVFVVLRVDKSSTAYPYLLQLATYLTISSHLWPTFITYCTSHIYRQHANQLLRKACLCHSTRSTFKHSLPAGQTIT